MQKLGNSPDTGCAVDDRHLIRCALQDDATGSIEQTVQDLQEAMQLDPGACSSRLPWQDIPDEAFCSLLAALLPPHQAYRVTSAIMRVLKLRLASLSRPAPQRLASTLALVGDELCGSCDTILRQMLWTGALSCVVCHAGSSHTLPLAHLVFGPLLVDSALNTYQAELIARALREGTSRDLAADAFSAAAETQDWGASWNESTVTLLTHILDVRPAIPEVPQLWHLHHLHAQFMLGIPHTLLGCAGQAA